MAGQPISAATKPTALAPGDHCSLDLQSARMAVSRTVRDCSLPASLDRVHPGSGSCP
jgi:hypothetical protein